jgi:hypothetical protein
LFYETLIEIMRKLVYFATVTLGLILGGCTLPQMIKLAKQQNLTVTPNPLEVHKDTVVADLSAVLPVKMLKPGTVYTLNSYYKFGDKEQPLSPAVFNASDYPTATTQQPKLNKKLAFAYQPAMKSGVLQIEGVASKGTKSKSTPRLDVATGVITTSKLVQDTYYAAYANHGYNNQEELIPVVIPDFKFEQGSAKLRKSEIEGATGSQLDAFIASKNITRTVTITGTHSPEGRERINSKLSEERAAAIEKFYRDEMKKYDYKNVADEIRFILKPVVDDWNEFKSALAGYNGISADDKAAYLNVINAGGAFEEVEKQLSKLAGYKKVYNDIYPGLRTAKTEIFVVKVKKTDVEISVLAKQIVQGSAAADALSIEELLYAATLTPSTAEKIAIYTAATKKASHWVAHNNLAAAYLAAGIENPATLADNTAKAAAQLDIAARLGAGAEAQANAATIALIQGNPYKAAAAAARALNGASNEVTRGVNGVKAAAEIHIASYAAAATSAAGATGNATNLFNKGLALLLNGDHANAASAFGEAINASPNFALAHYGAAIAAAHAGNGDGVATHLSHAVKADSSLKEAALADLEFAKFASSDAFRNALK